MTAKALPPVATKIPSKLDWDFNASTGNSIAQLNPVTRLVRSGRDGKFLYRAEYWGDHSLAFPIGSNALTASKALEDLKKDVTKLKRGTPRRKSRGLGDSGRSARSFYTSAVNNFTRIRQGQTRGCAAIEHYTDVVVEAATAETLAHSARDTQLAKNAAKLQRTATNAQRGAVALCRRGHDLPKKRRR